MDLFEVSDVTISLSAVPASQASFNVPILLVDHADVPIDRRYRTVTKTSYTSALTSATAQYNWCSTLWSQTYNPSIAYIGRWVSAASAPYCTHPDATAVASVYAALAATAAFDIDDGVNNEDITPDFTGDTTMADVCASIQTALAASVNFATFTCSLDALSRPTIYDSATGAAAGSFTINTPSAGVDLTGSAYLGDEISQAGLDAEALGAAYTAIMNVDQTPYIWCQNGGTIAQQVAFSTVINAAKKVLLLVNNDSDAKDSGASTDVGYQIAALSHNRSHIVYTEHTSQYPDAAAIGATLSKLNGEGAVSMALNALTGVYQSGLDVDGTTAIPLTSDEKAALEAKGYDYIDTYAGITFLRRGLAAGGNEMRIMIGKDFMGTRIAEANMAYLIANDVVTYSNPDIQAFKGNNEYWAQEMVSRKMLDGDSFVYNYPDESEFTSSVKSTHVMTLSDVFTSDVQSSVNELVVSMSLTI